MKVSSTDVKAYKAVVIIILVVMGSPVVKEAVGNFWNKRIKRNHAAVGKGAES